MKSSSAQWARHFQSILISALCVAAAGEASAATIYNVGIVNRASSSIVAFDVAPAGSRHYRAALRNNAALPGHGGSGVIAIRDGDGGCLHDLRVRFADGHVVTHENFDLCAAASRTADRPDRRQQLTVFAGGVAIDHGKAALP